MQWTTEQVMAAAPDAQVAASGKKLADAKHWRNRGCDDQALWGECQGSAVYQVRVALSDMAAKCSCPSRKFPCKHAVGLLLLAAQAPAAIVRDAQPEWVSSWLEKRDQSAARKTKPAEERNDPEAKAKAAEGQARRAAQRHERVLDGLGALDLWMADLVRNGLAELETKGTAIWEQQAARLVDAQAPALATRLRALATLPGSGDHWAERLLGELGRIALLTHAYRRLDRLRPELQWDVRSAIGWTMTEEEVHASGERLSDDWLILGSLVEETERIRAQRTWLHGTRSGRTALVLQFAAGGANFTHVLIPGLVVDADVVFWPSAHPQRALLAEQRAQKQVAGIHPHPSFAPLLDSAASAIAAQPWLWRIGVAIADVVPEADARGQWRLRDRDHNVLPLAGHDHWRLLALSGGHAIGLTAEWDGHALTPLVAVIDGAFHRLTGVH